MGRILAGVMSFLLLLTGGVLLWRGSADAEPSLPPAPEPRFAAPVTATLQPIGQAPSADPKTKEEKRIARAVKDEDGKITLAELVEPRRKPFAKLDVNQDGKLSFEEWAIRTIDKYEGANDDKNGWLTPAEYASTAPKRKAKPKCGC